MFDVEKKARMSETVAASRFSTAEVKAFESMRIPGSRYFGWDFTTTVIGCGDSVPADFNPDEKFRFKMADDYDVQQISMDVASLVGEYGLKTMVDVINGGLDLDRRNTAPPKPKAKMDDGDKAAWVISNGKMGKAKTLADFVKVYDDLNA